MPTFYRRLQTRLRTPEQGADTVVWLAVAKAVTSFPSGTFFQGTVGVGPPHLALFPGHSRFYLAHEEDDLVTNECSGTPLNGHP